MPLQTILVCLTTPANADMLMKAATQLARTHDAHLIGLHTVEALVVYPGIAMHIPDDAFSAFNASQRRQYEAIREIFDKHTASEDFSSEWRLVRADSTTASARMVESARAADLVIMAQESRGEDRPDQADAPGDVIRDSGRPVLLLPHDYAGDEIGNTVVLGWSGTREATRAAHDLLDLAAPDAAVHILRVGSGDGDELADYTANDLAASYDRHGLKANVVHRERRGDKIADILSHEAFEVGADLIVTGAFGHSRTYDFVIGAATRALMAEAKLPVLFSK